MDSFRPERRAPKPNKACVPCRSRKTKCDAAVVGIPCSSCTSRQCGKECALLVRKSRTRKRIHGLPIHSHGSFITSTATSSHVEESDQSYQLKRPKLSTDSDSVDNKSQHRSESDLLYLNILNDAVSEGTASSQHQTPSATPYRPSPEDNLTPRDWPWAKLPQLDDIDREYLVKKGVFDLPTPRHLDELIKTYFDHVYPFAPVINRADFVRDYQTGDCSLFLLRAILVPTVVHASLDLLSACGFISRSAAQESFFSKANLLHDFSVERDPLLMLQGSIIMTTVMLDHSSDRDFAYWFHNSLRLASKLDLRKTCVLENKPSKLLRLYRRIWWSLYILDIFHFVVDTGRSRLFENNTFKIKPRTEDDWDVDQIPEVSSCLLSPFTPQQRALPVVQSELFLIVGHCLSIVTKKPQQDPRQLMHPLDAWRQSLPAKMNVGEHTGTDVYYLNLQAMSYRFECILCRLIRGGLQQPQYAEWRAWAKQRLRSAVLELDTIAMRVLASGTIHLFPMPFHTTIPALLALHIESALDPAETELVRSMARISISQTMLILTQGKDIPVLKRALPIFEKILAKKILYSAPPNSNDQVSVQWQFQDSCTTDTNLLSNTEGNVAPSQMDHFGDRSVPYGDFMGLDFLDDWRLGDWISQFDVDMASHE